MTRTGPLRRHAVVKVLILLLVTLLSRNATAEAPAKDRPNIVMMFADDLTFNALGFVGQTEVKTPNIDRLAKRGLTFNHAFIQGGTSGAVCVASRAMLMTGRYLWACGKDGDCARADKTLYPLWGQVLGDAGYQTFAVGKWHNGPASLAKGFQTTNPVFMGGMLESTESSGPAYSRPRPGNEWTPDDPRWKGHWLTVDGKIVHSSERWTDAAIDDLSIASRSDRPFFVYVAYNAPHDPRQAPKRFLDMYAPDLLALPPNVVPRHPFDLGGYEGRDEILAPYPRTPSVVRTHLQEYYAIISHLDTQVGRLLDAIERTGKADKTIVIFAADNGLAVGRHGLLGKQCLYEHSIRVPLIVAGPGIPSGRQVDAMVYIGSLFATTCELAGVKLPDTVQFPSLVPLIVGRKAKLYGDIYGGYVDRQRMVRTERWKLILTPGAGVVQLFDIKDDPWEMHNQASDPARAGLMADLYGRLKTWMKIVGDPMPVATLDALFNSAGKDR